MGFDREIDIRNNWLGTGEDRDFLLGKIDILRSQLKIATDALEKIHAPDYGGVQGMVIADMGFQHFCQHTAKMSLLKIHEMGK